MYSICRLLCASGLFVAVILVGDPGRSVDCFVDCREVTCWTSISDMHYLISDLDHTVCKAKFRDVQNINTTTDGTSFDVYFERHLTSNHVCDPTNDFGAVSTACACPLGSTPRWKCYPECKMQGGMYW